jgi:hypothetical protein
MLTFPSPIIGIVFGINLICFRSVVAVFLEKTIAKFPYYKMGGVNISFKVRPIFIAAFGAIVSVFSIFGLIIM